MRSTYEPRESITGVINELDLFCSSVNIPGTDYKLVDYDYLDTNYKLVVESPLGDCSDFILPVHASLATLATEISKREAGIGPRKKKRSNKVSKPTMSV